jgi:hypothetical protein
VPREGDAMLTNPDTSKLVMPGLDPGIHQPSQDAFLEGDGLLGQARQ